MLELILWEREILDLLVLPVLTFLGELRLALLALLVLSSSALFQSSLPLLTARDELRLAFLALPRSLIAMMM
jgi:hypothetical protein